MSTTAPPQTVLVVGATGRTGRHIVAGLLDAGVQVRALVRQPEKARLPEEVTMVRGTLQDPETLREAAAGTDAAFLLWAGFDPSEVPAAVTALTEETARVVYLSAAALSEEDGRSVVQEGIWADVEQALESSGTPSTFLRGGGFAVNTLDWAEQIRAGDVVSVVHPDAGRSLVDERDLAEAAVAALLDPALAGRAFSLTGPATLTQREQVATIGAVLGRDLTVAERDPAEAHREYAEVLGAEYADMALDHWATLVESPEPVTTGVQEVLGRPPRSYEDWVRHHRQDFADSVAGA